MGDKYGNAGAVKLALVGQTFFFALSAFAPFGFVGDPTLAATLLLFTPASEPGSRRLVSAMLYIFDRAPSSEARLSHQPCGPNPNQGGQVALFTAFAKGFRGFPGLLQFRF